MAVSQSEILNKVSAIKSLCETPAPLGGGVSLGNLDGNILPFLLDALAIIAGRESFRGLIDSLLGDFIPDFEQEAKGLLLTALSSTKFANVPVSEIPCLGGGFNIPYSSLDIDGKLKAGFANLDKFEKALADASLSGQKVKIDSILSVQFDSTLNEYSFTLDSDQSDKPLYELFEPLIDETFELNTETLAEDLIDAIFNIRGQDDKFLKQKAIDKLLRETEFNDFQFSRFDFLEASSISESAPTAGFIANGCDGIPTTLSEEEIELLITDTESLAANVSNIAVNATGSPESEYDSDRSLIERLLAVLVGRLVSGLGSTFLLTLIRTIDNNCNLDISSSSLESFISLNLPNIRCLVEGLREAFFDKVVDLIEEELRDLILCLGENYARERFEAYERIIRSLTFI